MVAFANNNNYLIFKCHRIKYAFKNKKALFSYNFTKVINGLSVIIRRILDSRRLPVESFASGTDRYRYRVCSIEA